MGGNILFLTASIKSHVLPALYVASLIEDNKRVFFATANDELKQIVENNGYNTIGQSNLRILRSDETTYISTFQKKKISSFRILKALFCRNVFRFRSKELKYIFDKIRPKTVIIDIFNSSDYFIIKQLFPYTNVIFYNPMLSIYSFDNLPFVSDSFWPKDSSTISDVDNDVVDLFTQPFMFIHNFLYKREKSKLLLDANICTSMLLDVPKFTSVFRGIPELILAPLEFEFVSEVRQEWQYYLGLCTNSSRVDYELDINFEQGWDNILSKKNDTKILYCSFGSFYSDREIVLFKFIY